MKIILQFQVNDKKIPLDIRRTLTSFIKFSLCKEKNELFEKFYGVGKTVQKQFAFDIKMPNPNFKKDYILLENNELQMTIVTNNSCLAIDFYNSFLKQRKKSYPLENGNFIILQNVTIKNHDLITGQTVLIKMLSPLVVRSHEVGKKDYYYQYDEEQFNQKLNESVRMQLKNCSFSDSETVNINIEPISAKKVYVKTFGVIIPCSIGVFRLTGETEVISMLYQMGMGSKRSVGFGVFEVLK